MQIQNMIVLEIDIRRDDLRRHWNCSSPRAKGMCSRSEVASERLGRPSAHRYDYWVLEMFKETHLK